jgi:nucleotide-binding universal stress UspA family protein
MRVLVAVEDKYDAVPLVECIRNRSWPGNTKFTLVHVVDAGNRFDETDLLEESCEDLNDAATAAFRLLLQTKEQLREQYPDSEVEVVVCAGEPTEEILEAIYRAHPQVLVIGKHRRNPLLKLFHEDVGGRLMTLIPIALDAVHVVDVPPLKRPVTTKSKQVRREKCKP